MTNNLETIYENMLAPSMVLRVIKHPVLDALESEVGTREENEDLDDESEEDLEESEECEIARDILSVVSELDDLAKEAMYKSFRRKIESCSDRIRDLANEIIEGHGKDV